MQRRRCNDEIRLREGIARLAAVLDEEPPLEHDVFGNREDALLEHWSYLVREPIVEFGAPSSLADQFNAEPNFSEAHRADIE